MSLPDGKLVLGKDLPPPPGEPLYLVVLIPIDDAEAVEFLDQYDADRPTGVEGRRRLDADHGPDALHLPPFRSAMRWWPVARRAGRSDGSSVLLTTSAASWKVIAEANGGEHGDASRQRTAHLRRRRMTRSATQNPARDGARSKSNGDARAHVDWLATVLMVGAERDFDRRVFERALLTMSGPRDDPRGNVARTLHAGLTERIAFYDRAGEALPPAERPSVRLAASLIEAALRAQQAGGDEIAPFPLLVTDFLLAQACLLLVRGADVGNQISFARVIERSAAATAAGDSQQPLREWLVAAIDGEAPPAPAADPDAARRDDARLIDDELRRQLRLDPRSVSGPMDRLLAAGGKRVRPRLALATGRVSGALLRAPAFAFAVALEFIHSATLVHDDYVDGSPVRRSRPTVAAAEGTRAAVTVGTYYFAKAARSVAELDRSDVAITFSRALRALCLSQLDELSQRGSFPGDRQSYLRVVRGKTAALFAAASAGGAQCADASPITVARVRRYGELLGVAFQMVDDLIDFSDASGKPVGQDIRDRTVSLPLSYALEDARVGPELLRILRGPVEETDVRRALDLVAATNALARVRAEARRIAERAVRGLARGGLDRELPDLVELAETAVGRSA